MTNIIYAYTREQALADGVLVDVTETAKEAGIKYPVAVTEAVWNDINNIPKSGAQDVSGRLWDLLFMFTINARRFNGDTMQYTFLMRVGRSQKYTVKAVIGPGDTPEPVITIMLPHED